MIEPSEKTVLRRLVRLFIVLSCCGLIAFAAAYVYLISQLPDVDTLKDVHLQIPLRIYTADKQLIAEYGEKRRIPVHYDEVPQLLIRAILATEDQRYFEHPGVDIWGLGRAAVQLVRTGSKSQGGSTITMQVARNFFLSRKKTYLRKFNEILLAIKIDHELSKQKILELYLNKIYLGYRAYGVAAAAQVYYGKRLDQLSLAEMAMIAGLPKAPSALNPLVNPSAAIKRRNHVLSRLYEENYIEKQQYLDAVATPLMASYHGPKVTVEAPYVAEVIRQAIYNNFGRDAYTRGYNVYTTINSRLQNKANQVIQSHILSYDRRHGFRGPIGHVDLFETDTEALRKTLKQHQQVNDLIPAVITAVTDTNAAALLAGGDTIDIPWQGMAWARPVLENGHLGGKPEHPIDIVQPGDIVYCHLSRDGQWQLAQLPAIEGAIVALDPKNGAIQALVGGFDYEHSKFNRVTQAKRQPGSSIKPFIYAAALTKGMTLASIINDAPVVLDDPSLQGLWRPQNDTRRFYGPTRLRTGLIRSRNLVTIRLLQTIGIDYAIDYLDKLGFDRDELPQSLSLALGSMTISPLDLTRGYAVIANGGFLIDPYIISTITDGRDTPVVETAPKQACDPCEEGQNAAPRVMDKQINYLINLVLRDVIQHGTGRAAKQLHRSDIAGKTGTTNDQVDAWFAGFNRDLVTTAWMGFDKPRSTHEYAAGLALPVWIDFMRSALKNLPLSPLARPDGMVTMRIDPHTGLAATSKTPNAIFETFRREHTPKTRNSQADGSDGQTDADELEQLF